MKSREKNLEILEIELPLQSQAIFTGSLAQLVQSVCLTSRGSGGSNPSAPTKPPQDKGGFFVGLTAAHIFPLSREGEFSRELSSVGSERLPYKQRVGGLNPSAPTRLQPSRKMVFYAGSIAQLV